MRQTILSEPLLILETTETAGAVELDEEYEGNFLFVCTVAGSENVRVEIQQPGTTTWIDLRIEGKAQNLARAGDAFVIPVARALRYRCETATAGAEVWIASL